MHLDLWDAGLLILSGIGLGGDLYNHGKDKGGKYNFWSGLVGVVIVIFLYYKAGMFA
jgi:hypothetical protein